MSEIKLLIFKLNWLSGLSDDEACVHASTLVFSSETTGQIEIKGVEGPLGAADQCLYTKTAKRSRKISKMVAVTIIAKSLKWIHFSNYFLKIRK